MLVFRWLGGLLGACYVLQRFGFDDAIDLRQGQIVLAGDARAGFVLRRGHRRPPSLG